MTSITSPSPTKSPIPHHASGDDRSADRAGGSDDEVTAAAAERVARPRVDPADSFVLHAPLEIIARRALLPFVRPSSRDEARLRIAQVGEGFDAWGPPVEEPQVLDLPDATAAARVTLDSVMAGDLEEVDSAAATLGRLALPTEMAELLAADLVPLLGAAAHAPIFLFQIGRVGPRGEVPGTLLRPLARELARHPDWALAWVGQRPAAPASGAGVDYPDPLIEAIGAAPALGIPGSSSIQPLMSQVDGDLAADLLGPVVGGATVRERGRALLRIAAWSMLEEPPDHAPYGWSHCLTIPQAVMGVAPALVDPGVALAVAATHVLGFRAALAERPLVPSYDPEHPRVDPVEGLLHGPGVAAAAVWHAEEERLPAVVTELCSRAAVHHDAHLVKYTLACMDAASDDAPHRRLFLAAAASLSAWWAERHAP